MEILEPKNMILEINVTGWAKQQNGQNQGKNP